MEHHCGLNPTTIRQLQAQPKRRIAQRLAFNRQTVDKSISKSGKRQEEDGFQCKTPASATGRGSRSRLPTEEHRESRPIVNLTHGGLFGSPNKQPIGCPSWVAVQIHVTSAAQEVGASASCCVAEADICRSSAEAKRKQSAPLQIYV